MSRIPSREAQTERQRDLCHISGDKGNQLDETSRRNKEASHPAFFPFVPHDCEPLCTLFRPYIRLPLFLSHRRRQSVGSFDVTLRFQISCLGGRDSNSSQPSAAPDPESILDGAIAGPTLDLLAQRMILCF